MLNMLCSYLKAEDVLMLRETLPIIRDCSNYKKLMSKTKRLNQIMIEISEYRELHESCIHVCLPQITVNPHLTSDDDGDDEDVGMCCY